MADARLFLPALAATRTRAVGATLALLADVPEAHEPLSSGQSLNPTLSELMAHLRLDQAVTQDIGSEVVGHALALVVADQRREMEALRADVGGLKAKVEELEAGG